MVVVRLRGGRADRVLGWGRGRGGGVGSNGNGWEGAGGTYFRRVEVGGWLWGDVLERDCAGVLR